MKCWGAVRKTHYSIGTRLGRKPLKQYSAYNIKRTRTITRSIFSPPHSHPHILIHFRLIDAGAVCVPETSACAMCVLCAYRESTIDAWRDFNTVQRSRVLRETVSETCCCVSMKWCTVLNERMYTSVVVRGWRMQTAQHTTCLMCIQIPTLDTL